MLKPTGREPICNDLRILVLPDVEWFPTHVGKESVIPPIPGGVQFELVTPPIAVGLGRSEVIGARVPEASIHEDGESRAHNRQVGPAGKITAIEPEAHSPRVERSPERKLGFGVLGSLGRHEGADAARRGNWLDRSDDGHGYS
ncbi:MAG: hypothetical protein U0904_10920 [Candidatus Nanopelagicales bacterium]|nr:hypothetical protein [Candidatus Nanopelagicales bacterium]